MDVNDIEMWLEQAPATHVWLSEHLGLRPHGLQSAEGWWQNWSTATTPVITPEFVLAGRGDAVKQLRARLAASPQVTTISGGSLEEILAFVAAVSHGDPISGEGYVLPRVLFVKDAVVWRRLIEQPNALILVPLLEELVQEIPSRSLHHFIIPVIGASNADIILPPIDPDEAAAALRAAGLPEKKANEGGRLARLSLLALRRTLANKRELLTPPWARPHVDRMIRRVLLAGRWSDCSKGDQAALAKLTGLNYEALREELLRLKSQEDPLLALVHGTWCLVSPHDAWRLLRTQIQPDDLERFKEVVLEVLGELDPSLEFAPKDRWKASFQGKVRTYSADLRQGLATSLALLGIYGDQVDVGGGSTGTDVASFLVSELLHRANGDPTCRYWSSLSDVLPLLAEADPDAFLVEVRAGLQGDPPLLVGLFSDRDEGGLFGPSSPHTALLRALERVAWSPDHFGQAVDLLARLAEIDPGGRLTNRSIQSLVDIYCPWHPETSVGSKTRLVVFDALRQRHPEIAWRLGLDILPETHQSHLPTDEPRYRDWKMVEAKVTNREYFSFVSEVVSRLIQDAGTSPVRWSDLLERSEDLPPNDWVRVRSELAKRVDTGELSDQQRTTLWETLRRLIARHRRFPDANWALPSEELNELEKIERALAPRDPFARYLWLFKDHCPDLGIPIRRDDYASYEATVQERRKEAIVEIEASGGLHVIRRLAAESANPWVVGVALAEALSEKYEREVLRMIGPGDSSDVVLALAFAATRFREHGWAWLEGVLKSESDLNSIQRGRLLEATRDFPRAWVVAAELGDDVARAFWQHFRYFGLGLHFTEVDYAANALMAVGRNAAALQLILPYIDVEGDTHRWGELIIRVLEGLLRAGEADPEFRSLSVHDFQYAFEYLERHKSELGWERIARLEWAFLSVLGHKPKVDTLHRLLATDPSFFVEVVSLVYRPRSKDEEGQPSEEKKRMAENGYRLLSSWSIMPGLRSDGRVDAEVLRKWVSKAIQLLTEVDRREVGEEHIGQVLAYAPPDPDGHWPCIEVRDLLEMLQSEHVERGLSIAVHNSRGVTWRTPGEGGRQERELAKKYREQADAYKDRWPRIAAILRQLAEDYEREARWHDEDAERFRIGLD
ncbi:hypothetical protein [Calditerricola yamamurae]